MVQNNRNLFSCSFGGQKLEISYHRAKFKVSAGLVLSEVLGGVLFFDSSMLQGLQALWLSGCIFLIVASIVT